MSQIFRIFLVFCLINFSGLYLGSLSTSPGVLSDWYINLNQAPWTPPGYIFGLAWTTIMLCFSYYMSLLWLKTKNKLKDLILFGLSWLLNFAWNPFFFVWHQTVLALLIISGLLILLVYLGLANRTKLGLNSFWITPYTVWLAIATSLNYYIVVNNT